MTDKVNKGETGTLDANGKGAPEQPDDSRFEKSNLMDNEETNMAFNHNDDGNDLELPRRIPSDIGDGLKALPKQYLSENMEMLQKAVVDDNAGIFTQLAFERDIVSSEEAILVMYTAVALMNRPDVFRDILEKNNKFKFKPDWHVLFSQPNIF